ncbi:hypothetical protein HDU98_000170 [Podochytrium sp. JEL0797]|nr:hypothetical protein HDU98_000170 [Podochytrium sp. JEL0797]
MQVVLETPLPWHRDDDFELAIATSVARQVPLVVLVEDSTFATNHMAMSLTLSLSSSGLPPAVFLRLAFDGNAASQFQAIFPFESLGGPSLHRIENGKRTAFADGAHEVDAFARGLSGVSDVPPSTEVPASEPSAAAPTSSSSTTPTVTITLRFSHSTTAAQTSFSSTPTSPLSSIRNHIIASGFIRPFDLVQPYPLRVFTRAEELKSIQDLGLVHDSRVVLVVKKREFETRKIGSGAAAASKAASVEAIAKPTPVYTTSSLSIRLPNGSQIRSKFPATDTLSTVRSFIHHHLASTNPTIGDAFEIIQTYPHKNFSVSDESVTLKGVLTNEELRRMTKTDKLDLDLLPSATLAIHLPATQSSSYPATSSILTTLTTPFHLLFSYLAVLATWFSTQFRRPATAAAGGSPNDARRDGGRDARASAAAKRNVGSLANIRKQDEDKDTKETYNGNSTAQE